MNDSVNEKDDIGMYKIVLIDDEPWALLYLKKVFSREDLGYEVVAAESSSDTALRMIEKLKPDVVITDVCIPNMTGLELLLYLREHEISCEVVIVSAFAEFAYVQAALRYGAFDYCIKPVSADDAEKLLYKLKMKIEKKEGVVREVGNNPEVEDADSDYVFQKILVYINNHYKERIMIKELAADFGFTPNYCSSLFVRKTGMTFSQYLTRLRMEQSILMLKNPALSLKKIAVAVGYEDEVYFHKVFKKYYGITPVQYREKANGNKSHDS